MSTADYSKTLCDEIARFRKNAGMTQHELADRLNIFFQAVSKWETGLSCPDIALLPQISEIFGISIDKLFGKDVPEEVGSISTDLPWEDDGKLRAVVFIGTKYADYSHLEAAKFTFEYKGTALSIESAFSVACKCDSVNGNISARNGSVVCNDVNGDINATGNIVCGNVEGDVSAGGNLKCDCIEGDATAGMGIKADEINGDVQTNGEVKAGTINGDVRAKSVVYEKIDGVISSEDT